MKLKMRGNCRLISVRIHYLLVCLVCLQWAFFISCAKEDENAPREIVKPAKIMTVNYAANIPMRRYPGKVRASQRVDLAFKVSGPLIELPVREGQEVKKGDILARINPRDFETNLTKIKSLIAETRARLKAMEAGARPEDLKMLESDVAAARAQFNEAEEQFKRYTSLYKQKNISKSEYDRFKAAHDVSKAQLNTAVQRLEKGRKGAREEDIEAMAAQIRGLNSQQKAIQHALEDTYLKAPFSGIIAKKFVENYQEVTQKQPIVSLQDISKIEILVDVPEVFVIQAKEDRLIAVAEFPAAPGTEYPLRLKEFSSEADPNTQTYRAVLETPAPERINILPGMTATVKGTLTCTGILPNAEFLVPLCEDPTDLSSFSVPISAAFSDQSKNSYVWVVDPETMRVKRRQVKIGAISGENIRILDGLSVGEMIVTAGVHHLREGQKIRQIKTGGL